MGISVVSVIHLNQEEIRIIKSTSLKNHRISMLFIAFHALAFIIMVDESTGCKRKCEDIISKDGYWKIPSGTISKSDNHRCCKPFKRFTITSGGLKVPDCKKKNEDRTTWRGKVEAYDMEAGIDRKELIRNWTFGECSNNEGSCLNARYDSCNITEIMGVQLATLDPDSIKAALIESLTLPIVDSMNCEELCNCLSCGHGHCSNQEYQNKCYGKGSGFICKCENSDSYPSFSSIVKDVLATGMACRQCET